MWWLRATIGRAGRAGQQSSGSGIARVVELAKRFHSISRRCTIGVMPPAKRSTRRRRTSHADALGRAACWPGAMLCGLLALASAASASTALEEPAPGIIVTAQGELLVLATKASGNAITIAAAGGTITATVNGNSASVPQAATISVTCFGGAAGSDAIQISGITASLILYGSGDQVTATSANGLFTINGIGHTVTCTGGSVSAYVHGGPDTLSGLTVVPTGGTYVATSLPGVFYISEFGLNDLHIVSTVASGEQLTIAPGSSGDTITLGGQSAVVPTPSQIEYNGSPGGGDTVTDGDPVFLSATMFCDGNSCLGSPTGDPDTWYLYGNNDFGDPRGGTDVYDAYGDGLSVASGGVTQVNLYNGSAGGGTTTSAGYTAGASGTGSSGGAGGGSGVSVSAEGSCGLGAGAALLVLVLASARRHRQQVPKRTA